MHETAPISVVICAYSQRRLAQIGSAIASVLEQSPPPSEVILIIDHNPSLERQARSRWPMIAVHASTGPLGLSGARNCGVAFASSPLVAFLDDDATAASGWLAGLHLAFADDEVEVVGGAASPRWERRRPTWLPPEFDWVVGCTHIGMPVERASVRNVVGCNMAFRRAALVATGGFATNFGRTATGLLGCEETEVCIRVRERYGACAVLYDPAISVDHAVPAPRSRIRYYLRRCVDEGRSKARVAKSAGPAIGLSEERRYVARTLPRGVATAVLTRQGLRSGGIQRAAAILAGLAATVVGYGVQRAVLASTSGRSQP